MKLLNEESTQFSEFGLTVTNRRLRYEKSGKMCFSMELSSISSMRIFSKDNPYFLLLAILSGIVMFGAFGMQASLDSWMAISGGALVMAAYFAWAYKQSAESLIVIYGQGSDHIDIEIRKAQYSTALDVVDKIEMLKFGEE